MSSSKAIDYHRKVEGRDRRVTLSSTSAKCIFLLNRKLGHRTFGETIEWLLRQVKPTIDAIIHGGRKSTIPIFPSLPLHFPTDPSMEAASISNAVALPLIPSIFETKIFLAPVGSVFAVVKGSVGNDDDDDDKEDEDDDAEASESEKKFVTCNCISFAGGADLQKYFRL